MEIPLTGVTLISVRRFADTRGYFSETYNRSRFSGWGINLEFVQDNHTYSKKKGTIRGLHFQRPPHAQAKLVRVLKGRIIDVAVDIRHVSVELSPGGSQLYIPVGYLHGFVTLEPDTEVAYKVSNVYDVASDSGICWHDPDIGIDWGVPIERAVVSDKEAALPFLAALDTPFDYNGVPLELRNVG